MNNLTRNGDHVKAVVQAVEYMKKNLDKEITTEELASLVGYSSFHFSRFFKEVTGISPRHYLSALRIEAGKQMLVRHSSPSIIKTMMSIGFSSLGSFSAKFKQFVGLPPKQFQVTTNDLYHFVNQYTEGENSVIQYFHPPVLTCHIEAPAQFKGFIFVGLFPRPIPDERPAIGTAFTQKQSSCIFSQIPTGTYYALAAGIPLSMNPKDYFLLEHAFRGMYDDPIHVTGTTDKEIHIKLRSPLPFDPPILINLPQLLLEQVQKVRKK
ncbi:MULTISPECIES: AraC family transcriptional regulator [Bacillaceae]|uniref:AraC family transcriptional regulator n=1 Tax=Bacillaceae TaxID=186817 RepID=UPI002A182A65|nr:AraC family transcriptional regulator [Cytobacillus sp. IB215316]MDX8362636.1 AraC family transcriptional regulator [Cytobacillus sp. IB215316]